MGNRFAKIFILTVAVLLFALSLVWAGSQSTAVPDASALVLAPIGFGAVVVMERRRRRLARLKRGVGTAYHFVKRSIDILLATSLLLVAAPLFAVIALAVRAAGRGPILFRRRVIGKHGRSFDMFKFRSMVEGAEQVLEQDEQLKSQYYVNCKLKSDPRVTYIGRILRKTSLDELPQLLNIVLGDMTFVGPRPIHSDEVDIYGPNIERFKTVTPGVTGIWQTSGRSETSYADRVQMDMLYIEKRSILLDLWIIVSTVPAVLLRRGAC